VWHSLKYTNTTDNKLVYISEPVPEIHNYNIKIPTCAHNSESEPEQDPLDTVIHNSPAILKEPLAPETPIMPTPFFAVAKNDLSQILTMTTTTQTTTQMATQATAAIAIAPQHPLTAYELEELLNIAMGERRGGTRGNPPGPPGGGGPPEGGPAAAGAAAANIKAMGRDPPLFQGEMSQTLFLFPCTIRYDQLPRGLACTACTEVSSRTGSTMTHSAPL